MDTKLKARVRALLLVWISLSSLLYGSQQRLVGFSQPKRLLSSILEETTIDQVLMGFMYDELGNDTESVKWHLLAAESGHPISQYAIGCRYSRGEGLPQDDVEAFKWWHLAADQGLAGAQYYLGMSYCYGDGVDRDYMEGYKWFFEAAKQDHANAMSKIGCLYMHAQGVPFEPKLAIQWWTLAADLGDPEGQVYIGLSYQHGIGFPQNFIRAYGWYYMAALLGDEQATELRDELGVILSAEEQREAKQWVLEWLQARMVE